MRTLTHTLTSSLFLTNAESANAELANSKSNNIYIQCAWKNPF